MNNKENNNNKAAALNEPNITPQGNIKEFKEKLEKINKEAAEPLSPEELKDLINDKSILNNNNMREFWEKIQTEAYKPFNTGLSFFDDITGGIIKQSLVLLLAAPSVGKTTLAQQIAESIARQEEPVLYFNLEMSQEQMLAKAISNRLALKQKTLNITALKVLQGYSWNEYEAEAIKQEIALYSQDTAPYIQYSKGNMKTNIEDIKERLEEIGSQAIENNQKPPCVFLDYLHLVTSEKKSADPKELIKEVVTAFKQYAIKYNTFSFIIVAVNRDSASGSLTMQSGRDTSAIEYSGDYILALNYKALEDLKSADKNQIEAALMKARSTDTREMTIKILKHRLGKPGINNNIKYNAPCNLFYEQKTR